MTSEQVMHFTLSNKTLIPAFILGQKNGMHVEKIPYIHSFKYDCEHESCIRINYENCPLKLF